ncbi:hypothetical protein J6590_067835 [Homalodisca vitripennis]|nr:hypothetical protein J6590_067835 [Homalodisca vitripennis]
MLKTTHFADDRKTDKETRSYIRAKQNFPRFSRNPKFPLHQLEHNSKLAWSCSRTPWQRLAYHQGYAYHSLGTPALDA